MKGNLLNKVWLRVCMIVAVMTTAFAGTASADDQVYKTSQFGRSYNSGQITDYNSTWSSTYNNFTVTLANFCNFKLSDTWYTALAQIIAQTQWNYVACGGTNSPATITTAAPIDEPITKVDLAISRANNVSSITLQTSMDYVTWEDAGTFATGTGTKEVIVPEDMRSSNLFYRIIVRCTGSGEDDVRISQIKYYREVPDPNAVATPVISGEQQFETSTDVTITCATDGATIQYSLDGGSNWTNYTRAITLTETTTVKAKATKGTQPVSQIASKIFSKKSDVRDVTWDLTKTPTGTTSTSQVTWTTTTTGENFAVMSLSKSTSSTIANNYLGGVNSYTSFYQNQILRIAPLDGYSIVFVEIETTEGTYTAGLTGNTWSNAANTSVNGNKVKITPQDGTEHLSVIISGETHVTGVNVEYTPIFPPKITVAEETVTVSSAEVDEPRTIGVVYERIDKMDDAEVIVVDENNEAVTWITTAMLDENNNLTYTIAANTTLDPRTAYMAVRVGNVYSNAVTVTQEAAIKVTIAWFGYSTLYYGEKNLKLPANVEAYTYKKGEVKMVESDYYGNQDVIPAGTAVVLKGAPGDYAFVETTASGHVDADNELKGFDEPTRLPDTDEYYYYVLSVKQGSTPENGGASTVGFYWNAQNGGAFTSAAHKAYLVLPKSFASVKSFYMFSEDEPTGLNDVNVNLNDESIYNLAGQRIGKMQRGINIVNGKKILK